MNEPSPMNERGPINRREARRERRAERLAGRSTGGAWVIGLILIVLGGLFLLRNTGAFEIPLNNWWTVFILVPAIGAFDTALRTYRNAGNQLTAAVGSSLLLGLVLTGVTAAFIFGFNWSYFGPLLIIVAGIGILFNYTRRS